MTTHAFRLGAQDWLHPDWTGPLYPSDMPAEWRPAYFNLRFACVWLPHAVWSQAAPETVAEWLDETGAEFRFLLESAAAETPEARRRLDCFAPRLGAHCAADHPDLLWFDAGTDLRAFSGELLRRAGAEGATYVLSRDGDLTTIDKVATVLDLLGLGRAGQVG